MQDTELDAVDTAENMRDRLAGIAAVFRELKSYRGACPPQLVSLKDHYWSLSP